MMTDTDAFNSLRRSQEAKYFIQQDSELLARLRRRVELGNKLHEMTPELAEATIAANQAILADIQRLGYTRETLPLIYLTPILYVAWAEGGINVGERTRIVDIARERGIDAGSAADTQLLHWLEHRPSEELLETSIGIVQAIMHAHSPVEEQAEKAETIADVQRVLDASGDILLLWHQMTENEHRAIAHVIDELSRQHYPAAKE
jgi:hypothetical protein